MQIVKTRNHLIYSAETGAPSHACTGECGKVWWPSDLVGKIEAAAVPSCPQCGGKLVTDIPSGHYTVVTQEAGQMERNGAKITNAGMKIGR